MNYKLLAVAILLVAPCGVRLPANEVVPPQQVTPESDRDARYARVFVYRHHKVYGAALEPPVYCDGKEVAKMDNGRYFLLMLEPGAHSISSNSKKGIVELKFEAGKEYFIRVYLKSTYIWVGKGRAVLESNEQGKADLRELRPLTPSDVVDKIHVFVPQSENE